jgi:threonyl-tRNA synthetase
VDDSDLRMQNKIRVAQEQKVPCMLVLGDREVEARTATVRRRGAERGAAQDTLGWDVLAERLVDEASRRGPD